MTTRRHFLKGVGAASLVTLLPNFSFASTQSPNVLIWITLRGAMDGLNVVVPSFDEHYQKLRPTIALTKDQLNPLEKGFGLHPALKSVHQMYQDKQAMFVHACATGYRSRSHFDGQKILENGSTDPFDPVGWLNRFLSTQQNNQAIAIDAGLPLIVQGDVKVSSWFPHKLKAKEEQANLLAEMFQSDAKLSANFEEAMKLESMSMGGNQNKQFTNLAKQAGKFVSSPNGPNIVVLELGGWDTHSSQGADKGRLANQLNKFDQGMAALKSALGEKWQSTVVIAASEFGRTAAENGTKGTDHGTGNAMLVMGGAVQRSRVLSDWPGLASNQLYQGRDLQPTLDVRAVIKGVLEQHMGADQTTLNNTFPETQDIQPIRVLS
ncbi:DUF1501 domain-containing protein [Vibrio sp. SCSIO 43133]|uniref:DUF1501 domain-containing protein n=1 Tax=Vibrio sp. SCSIO 43133 TaxID=2802577 RepID=UPI00207573DB|nr:DUF1501 domain-containing protein [Vibrio sp. SCSIO 43133]USE02308.1 DUF1501 domain-containing protein [Vibrio sp. SCSIO 43133]